MESSHSLHTNIKLFMQKSDLSVNSKSLEILCTSGMTTPSKMQKLCEVFGQITSFEPNENSYIVTFLHSAEAMLAKETLEKVTIDDIGFSLKISWVRNEEIDSVFDVIPTPSVFIPVIRKNHCMKIEPPESLKYIARFPLNLQESEGFHLREKLLGAKGCNFRKIIEICSKDLGIPERPKDLIKIKMLEEPEITIKVTSRYCQKFYIASNLVYELITVVLEEYKRYCEIQGIIPSDLRIRKLEQIKGRCRILREGKDDTSVYNIPHMQEAPGV